MSESILSSKGIVRGRRGDGGARRRWPGILLLIAAMSTFPLSPVMAVDKVIMQIGWDHQFTYAGFYAAQWQGYYEEAGLEVEIKSAVTPDRKILHSATEVAAGRADFGTAAADFLIEIDQGAPLVLLASLFQQSPAAYFARKGAGLDSPADLVRLRVSRRVDDMLDIELQAMLLAEGIDPAKVDAYPREFTLDGLVEGRVDVIPGFLPLRLWQARRLGLEVEVLRPLTYGIDFYGNSLITHRQLVEDNPGLVERFRDASLRGWAYALDHPDEIAGRIASELPRRFALDEPEEFNRFEAEHVRKLMLYPIVPVGHVNPERWQRMHGHLQRIGVVENSIDVRNFIFDPQGVADARTARLILLLKVGISVLVIVALLFVCAAWLLRHAVNRRTEELRLSEERYRREKERAETTLESIGDGVITTSIEGMITYMNPIAERLTGVCLDEARQQPMGNVIRLVAEQSRVAIDDPVARSLGDPGTVQVEEQVLLNRHDGEEISVTMTASSIRGSGTKPEGVVVVLHDMTPIWQMTQQLSYQATHDMLTGLINRNEFERRAERLLATIRQDQAEHALCFIDLDQFKVVNDTCGHIAGDELLRQLGKALQSAVRQRDTLARLGGDEFGVLFEHCTLKQAQRAASSLQRAVQDFQFAWDGQIFRIGASIGLVAVDDSTLSLTELLKRADTACYMAKEMGRNRIHTYHDEDTDMAQRHGEMQWVSRINLALDEDRFCLYAQPIVSLDGNSEQHYEMLLRMVDERGEIVPPNAFLPAAERYGLIEQLDNWVVTNAWTLMEEHAAFFDKIAFISINLSGATISNSTFLDFVVSKLETSAIGPNRICFEITETAAIQNLGAANRFITALRHLGCFFALDDFGSGLSSFGYLKNLQVDYLKIDGIFVKDMLDDPIDYAMVKSINEIGQVMGMQTIAEFVESDAIKNELKEIGVNYAQGFGISKPQPLVELLGLE